MSVLFRIRSGLLALGAGFACALGLLVPTASQAQNDGSIDTMLRSSNPGYGSVASSGVARVARPKASHQPRAERSSRGVQVASLGGGYAAPKPRSLGEGGGVRWLADAGCLNGSLRGVVSHVAANYGSVTVNSTCRSHGHNARVGGAPKSQHLTGDAVDFRVHGNVSGAVAYLSGRSGGYKHMGGGLFHVDTGATRRF